MHRCKKQAFYLSKCMLVSHSFCWRWYLSFMSYLSWSLQFIWFLPGGDLRFSVIEVCSAIWSLVFCPWSFVLLKNAYQKTTLQILSWDAILHKLHWLHQLHWPHWLHYLHWLHWYVEQYSSVYVIQSFTVYFCACLLYILDGNLELWLDISSYTAQKYCNTNMYRCTWLQVL